MSAFYTVYLSHNDAELDRVHQGKNPDSTKPGDATAVKPMAVEERPAFEYRHRPSKNYPWYAQRAPRPKPVAPRRTDQNKEPVPVAPDWLEQQELIQRYEPARTNCLLFRPLWNNKKQNDVYGAFLPEANAFALFLKLHVGFPIPLTPPDETGQSLDELTIDAEEQAALAAEQLPPDGTEAPTDSAGSAEGTPKDFEHIGGEEPAEPYVVAFNNGYWDQHGTLPKSANMIDQIIHTLELRRDCGADPLKVLAFFCHGEPYWIMPGIKSGKEPVKEIKDITDDTVPGNEGQLERLAQAIYETGGENLRILLYCCSTGRTPTGGKKVNRKDDDGRGSFADQLARLLRAKEFGDFQIDAHTTAAHTTRNPNLRRFLCINNEIHRFWMHPQDYKTKEFQTWRERLKNTSLPYRFPFYTPEQCLEWMSENPAPVAKPKPKKKPTAAAAH